MALHARAALLAVLLAAPVAAFSLTLPSSGIRAGQVATLQTDADGGNYTLYAPTQAGDCRLAASAGIVPPNGALGGQTFDRAGPWILAIEDGSLIQERGFTVDPRPVQIHVTPQPRGSLTDYLLEVRNGAEQVPHAYVDLYLDGAFIRHVRTDSTGRLFVPHEALPFAGTYHAVAYRDTDDNNPAAPGVQVTDYPAAFTFQSAPACGGSPAYDAPEEHGAGTAGSSLTRLREPLDLRIIQGDYQVVHLQGTTNITLATLGGSRPAPSAVALFTAGVARTPASIGLTVTTGPGYVRLAGTWDVEADIAVHVDVDANQDGRPEASGSIPVPVERDQPVRFIPVGQDMLSYTVPARGADGRPGVHVLRFRLQDPDGNLGRPPAVPEGGVRLEGDLLGSSRVSFNSGGDYWEAFATPTSSDAKYSIVATWPGKATVRAVIDTPPDGGARATVQTPVPPLRAGVETDIKIAVARYNRDADRNGLCSPTPACAYEAVPDAVVELFWADTGQPVRGPSGTPYRYDPGGPGTDCSCFELAGTYYFLAVSPDRSGPMAAYATVSAGSQPSRHAYAPLPVVPRAAYNPVATPAAVLAGEQTSIQLLAPGLTPATRAQFTIRILNATGLDVAPAGVFQAVGTALYWTSALPLGEYKVWIDERLDVEKGLRGLNGTATPATIASRPAELRLAYTDSGFRPEQSTLGDLRVPRRDTYVLGNSFGAIQRLAVSVLRPDGTPATGVLTLTAHQNGTSFGLLSAAGPGEPTRYGGPYLFPPGEPRFLSLQGQSYYLVETQSSRSFTGELEVRHAGAPVHILAWGTGLGRTTATFRSTTSSLNTAQPAAGGIHFVAPQATVLNITTERGTALQPAVALDLDNLVLLQVRDPTGANVLEGLEVGLTRQLFGPTQRPGGLLHYPPGASAGLAAIGVRPDGTGQLNVVAAAGPATAAVGSVGAICYADLAGATACDRSAVATTPLVLPVLHASQIQYAPASDDRVLVDMPDSIQEGRSVDVRARTSRDPFPLGTVTAFGTTYPLFNGARAVAAPAVNRSTDYPVVVQVEGHPSVTRILTVTDSPASPAPPTPPPSSAPTSSPTPSSSPSPTQPPSPSSTHAPSGGSVSSSSSTTNGTGNVSLETHRVGGLRKILASPTGLTLAVFVVGAAVGGVVLLIMRARQRSASAMPAYDEPEPEDDTAPFDPLAPRPATPPLQPAPPLPSTDLPLPPPPADAAPPTVPPELPRGESDFERAAGDP